MPTKTKSEIAPTTGYQCSGDDQTVNLALTLCTSPDELSLGLLCDRLALSAKDYNTAADWPGPSLAACAAAGVYRWFLPTNVGGLAWSEADQVRGYLRLAAADLTTTFVITQLVGACKRIATSDNTVPANRFLNDLMSGKNFATVGISHLTTSSQHLRAPALLARWEGDHYCLNGLSPWVTGASVADVIVLAATMDDGRELLAAIPTTTPGMTCGPGTELVALSASRTDRVTLEDVQVTADLVLAGPMSGVLRSGMSSGSGSGGLQTSTLAAGLSRAAVNFLLAESTKRDDLRAIANNLDQQTQALCDDLIAAASGDECDAGELRGQANRLALRTTQAALTAAKGAGYVATHPVGRWCREALFFLVWSCPQPVAQEHLCELAGTNLSH